MLETRSRWQDWINLVLGAWLFLMPFFGYVPMDSAAGMNSVLFGSVIMVISVAVLTKFFSWEEWISFAIGLWLIAAPFLFGFATGGLGMWNSIIIGLFIAGDALWGVVSNARKPSGHHPSHA
jgi:hypothetical protein